MHEGRFQSYSKARLGFYPTSRCVQWMPIHRFMVSQDYTLFFLNQRIVFANDKVEVDATGAGQESRLTLFDNIFDWQDWECHFFPLCKETAN
jgi:hypothetical protein